MNLPWLKSLIFWGILIAVLVVIFQCTAKSESNKVASAQSYERLYSCMRDLDPTQHQAFIQSIQQQLKADLKQQTLMQWNLECRQAKPIGTQQDYITAIQQLTPVKKPIY